MATEEKKDDTPSLIDSLPKAKRHAVLQDITKQLKGHEVSEVFTVGGKDYLMTTIDADEELWCDGITQITSPAQALSSYRISRVCASIKSIDEVSVKELFDFPDDMSAALKKEYSVTHYGSRTWEMSQLMIWLGELPNHLVVELANHYTELNKRRKDSWDALKNSSAKTLGGKSKATSSPEKGSSRQAQIS